MNYKWHYDKLIETRIKRELDPNEYYEKHHILPKSMGGSNCKSNLVYLTGREHFLAHWLLWRMHVNTIYDSKAAFAFHCMTTLNQSKTKLSSRGYHEARSAYSKLVSLHRSGMQFQENHKKNIGLSSVGRISVWRKKTYINGAVYDALHIAARELNIPVNTVRNRIFNKNFTEWYYVEDI